MFLTLFCISGCASIASIIPEFAFTCLHLICVSCWGFHLWQFTKKGSIFICVRVLDTCQSDHLQVPAEVVAPPPPHQTFSLGGVLLSQVVPKSPSGSDTTGRVSDRDTIFRDHGSSILSEMHLVAPRLSMFPGPLSTREAVAAWRGWSPKEVAVTDTEPRPVTIVVSVEDTGKLILRLRGGG